MANKNFNDIKILFRNDGYDINRDKNNSRRFEVQKDKEIVLIKMPYSMTEFYQQVNNIGCAKYIIENNITNKKSKKSNNTKKPIDVQTIEVDDSIGAQKRQQLHEQIKVHYENNEELKNDTKVTIPSQKLVIKNNINDDNIIKNVNYDVKIPSNFDGYYFPKFTSNILRRTSIYKNVFLSGPSGTGKTELVMKLAKFIGQKVIRVNFSVGTTEQQLIGKFIVKNGQTEFVHGILPFAMLHGWWVLFDEIDYAMPEHLSVLQPVLEGDSLLITQNENEIIVPHEHFRIFATGNTKGRGDESQSYVGTGYLNLAFLDRWSIFEIDYTSKEKNIIKDMLGDDTLADQIKKYFNVLRKSSDNGEIINAVFSTRRMINFAEALKYGETLHEALQYEIYSRYDKHEVDVIKEFANDIWDQNHYKNWTLGENHFQVSDSTEVCQSPDDPNSLM